MFVMCQTDHAAERARVMLFVEWAPYVTEQERCGAWAVVLRLLEMSDLQAAKVMERLRTIEGVEVER